MPSYGFPDLTPSQIVTSLSEICNISIEEKDIRKPDATMWQEILMKIMCEVTGAAEDVFLQQPFWASSMFEYPELHADSTPIRNIIVVMEKYMPKLGDTDFSAMDVINPTSSRLRAICSAAINFIRFKQTRLSTFEQIKIDVEQGLAQQDMLLKRNHELQERIQKARTDRVNQEPEIEKIQKSIDQATLRMNDLQKTKNQLKKLSSETKMKIAEKKSSGDQLKLTILKLKEEMEKLSQKIVQSPEKMQSERESLELQLKNLQEELKEKRLRLSNMQKMRENFKQDGQDAEKGFQFLEALQASINKESELATEVSRIVDEIEDKNQSIQAQNSTKTQLQQMLSVRQEKLDKLSLQHKNRMKVLKEQLKDLVLHRDSCKQKEDSETARKCQILEQKAKAEAAIRDEKRLVQDRIEKMQELYSLMLEKFDLQSQSIASDWAEIRKALNK